MYLGQENRRDDGHTESKVTKRVKNKKNVYI